MIPPSPFDKLRATEGQSNFQSIPNFQFRQDSLGGFRLKIDN